MKYSLSLILYLTFAISLKAADIPRPSISGLWYNKIANKTIEIKTYLDGIKVVGIHAPNKWTWFDQINKNTYRDKYDNTIKIGSETIKYVAYRRNIKLTFIKVHLSPEKHNYDDQSENDYVDKQPTHTLYNQEITKEKKDNIYPSKLLIAKDLVGTWQVQDYDKKVYITDTRDGIKARFNNEKKWYSFTSSAAINGFISADGHSYTIVDGRLVWTDKTGKKKFYLDKISSELGD
jgi:hypothetical protein